MRDSKDLVIEDLADSEALLVERLAETAVEVGQLRILVERVLHAFVLERVRSAVLEDRIAALLGVDR